MDVVKGLRLLAASLLMFTGVVHLTMAAVTADFVMAAGSALFGVLYIVLAIGLFAGRRLFNYLGAVITSVGFSRWNIHLCCHDARTIYSAARSN